MPFDGTVGVMGTFEKTGTTTDDITLEILKNNTPVFSQTLNWDETGSIVLDESIPVLKDIFDDDGNQTQIGDDIGLRLRIDSPIDLSALQWSAADQPRLFYTASPDIDPLIDDNGDPLVSIDLIPDVDIYASSDLTAPLLPWDVGTLTGNVTITLGVNIPIGVNTEGDLIFTIKGAGAMSANNGWNLCISLI